MDTKDFFDRVNAANQLKSWCDERWNPEKETCDDCLGVKYPHLCFFIPGFEDKEIRLADCPFCGGQAHLQAKDSTYCVKCNDCGATGPTNKINPFLAGVEWNERCKG